MFNLKKRKKTKKLEEFELLDINLIKDTPLDYAYVMFNSNRVIKKENKELLMEIVLENPYSAQYIKLGSKKDFELTESIPELKGLFTKFKRRKAYSELLNSLIPIIFFYFFLFCLQT